MYLSLNILKFYVKHDIIILFQSKFPRSYRRTHINKEKIFGGKKMMRVLWLSRHELTEAQVADLNRIYGEIEVKTFKQSVSSWKDVVEAGTDCDVLAVVLPPAILADLTNPRNNSKPVIRAKANRVPTGNTIVNPATGKEEKEYRFEHAGWERVVKIEVVVEAL